MSSFVGKIKGYSIVEVTKGFLKKKKEYLEEILEKDSTIEEKMQNVLINKGLIFGLAKDKKLKTVYIFEAVDNDNRRILRFKENLILDEITKDIQDEFENDISNIFKELVSLDDYEKIEWNEKIIVPKKIKIGKFNITLGTLLFILGTIIGAIIDDISLGLCMGICLGCGSVVIINKDDKDKNDDNKTEIRK